MKRSEEVYGKDIIHTDRLDANQWNIDSMDHMQELRAKINEVDDQLIPLFLRRMEISEQIAAYKQANGLPIQDYGREQNVLRQVEEKAQGYEKYARQLYEKIMELSRLRQKEINSHYGLIGDHLTHSYSKQLHEMIYCESYRLLEVQPTQLPDVLSDKQQFGLNVTMPYKQTVIPYCAKLSEQAKEIGSVNTMVRNDQGQWVGYNTDYDGFCYLMQVSGIHLKGRKVLILGDGGASKTVQYAARIKQAKEVVVVSRKGPVTYDMISRHYDAEILINATPVGMYPEIEAAPVCLNGFQNLCGVIDLIYNPRRTALLMQAEEMGIRHIDGLAMLVAQAVKSEELFFHKKYQKTEHERLQRSIARDHRNLVLIGMPGCGKSTIGQKLGMISKRQVVDIDQEMEKRMRKPVSEILLQLGEPEFRKLEQELIAEVCTMTGIILVTGGGAVTTPNNKKLLKYNGYVYYIERDVEQLAIEGRPISQSRSVGALYEERKYLYRDFADRTIRNSDTIKRVASRIWEDFSGLR